MPDMSSAVEMSLEPIPRRKLAEVVAKRLLAEIRDKGLARGERIPSERELMRAFAVGRSTIREAINGLTMLGVLEIRQGQGAFVSNPDARATMPDTIATALARGITRELFEARRVVEVEVARLAAERRTDADVREIEQILSEHAVLAERAELAAGPSVRFHTRIAEAAHSEVLASFVTSIADIMTERAPILESQPGYREWEVEQHRSVFEPIRDGNPVEAAKRMTLHLDAVIPHHEHLGLP